MNCIWNEWLHLWKIVNIMYCKVLFLSMLYFQISACFFNNLMLVNFKQTGTTRIYLLNSECTPKANWIVHASRLQWTCTIHLNQHLPCKLKDFNSSGRFACLVTQANEQRAYWHVRFDPSSCITKCRRALCNDFIHVSDTKNIPRI